MSGKGTQRKVKEIAIYKDPEKLKLILNKLTWKILLQISDTEMYPLEVARKLRIHEQTVYYHMRKLSEA
ncbi:MAG: helix-turn-helix domain-containing protein, partial [Candidatus Bathyarchaeia archaeon]